MKLVNSLEIKRPASFNFFHYHFRKRPKKATYRLTRIQPGVRLLLGMLIFLQVSGRGKDNDATLTPLSRLPQNHFFFCLCSSATLRRGKSCPLCLESARLTSLSGRLVPPLSVPIPAAYWGRCHVVFFPRSPATGIHPM